MDNKTSDSQIKASRKWEDENRKKATLANYKRSAKSFIKNHATVEDLHELKNLIKEREDNMNKLKLVNLLGGNNFYALPENKEKLMKYDQIAPYVKEHFVLIDEESYIKLKSTTMLNVDDFVHIMNFKSELEARTYMGNQYEYWKKVENEDTYDFIVTNLKKEYRHK